MGEEESCTAFGGYPTTRRRKKGEDLACVFPFRYKGVYYNRCVDFLEERPYMEGGDLVDIPYGRRWCSLVDVLSKTGWKRKMWG